MKPPTSANRPDWSRLRDQVDMVAVATNLLGPAQGRKGERSSRRLFWSCPYHNDPNPSFCVEVGKRGWKCFGCGKYGDAAELVMHIRQVGFRDAVSFLAGDSTPYRPTYPRIARQTIPPRPAAAVPHDSLSQPDALDLVRAGQDRLWSPAGAKGLKYLRDRGLDDDTIRAARLGITDGELPMKGGPRGILLPWFEADELVMINLRQPEGRKPKYRQVYGNPALPADLYPGRDLIRIGRPLIVVEGEFDALLLQQELADLGASVVTLGSASGTPTTRIMPALLVANPVIVTADNDDAGSKFLAKWPASLARYRPPEPDNDWTETHARGANRLRYYWTGWLGKRTPWEALAAQEWPVMDDIDADWPEVIRGGYPAAIL